MNTTPEALPMPPSVMVSPAVHPAEIAAEKDNTPVEVPEPTHVEVPEPTSIEVPEPDNNINTYIYEVCNNISVFMKTNDDKLVTMNNVVEQLSNLGLSDNSAIESLNSQRAKYMEVLESIRSSFENINNITNFIL